jgi:hypothetical protein
MPISGPGDVELVGDLGVGLPCDGGENDAGTLR